jgi:hypothetical protein
VCHFMKFFRESLGKSASLFRRQYIINSSSQLLTGPWRLLKQIRRSVLVWLLFSSVFGDTQ